MTFKAPAACESMKDVRQAIDSLDNQLLDILAQRIQYIERAAQIKTDPNTIRDEARIRAILDKRAGQAEEHGYRPEFIRQLFSELIEYSVAYEQECWHQAND